MEIIFKEMLDEIDRMLSNYRYSTMEKIHIRQVVDYGMFLSEKERADVHVVAPACIFHDVGRYLGLSDHTEIDFGFLSAIIKRLGHSHDHIYRIYDCIKSHSISSRQKPSTLEQKVVFDADNLTLITPYGLARWFFMAKEWSGIVDIEDAIKNLAIIYRQIEKSNFYYTNTAREIARKNSFFTHYAKSLLETVTKYKV